LPPMQSHSADTYWHLPGSSGTEGNEHGRSRAAHASGPFGGSPRSTADIAALNAFSAALDAYQAVGLQNQNFVAAALDDYDRLLRLKLGRYPEMGEPIDPCPTGPLGPAAWPPDRRL